MTIDLTQLTAAPFSMAALSTSLPMRPKPLIPILVAGILEANSAKQQILTKKLLPVVKKTLWAFPDEMCNPTVGGGERTSRPLPDFGNGHLLFASHSDVTNSRIHVTPSDLGNLNRFQENRMYQRSRGVDVDTKQSKMNKKRVSREFLKSLRCCRQRERETPAGPRPGSVSVATYSGIIEYI